MEQVKQSLMLLFWIVIVLVIILVCLYETELLESGIFAADQQSEFLVLTLMELITLGCAFFSLRLFKFKSIHADLIERKAAALRKWGFLRLLMLQIPLLLNTLLYYFYMNPTFGYMAIILLLCLPFVYPSMNRCLSETEE